MTRIDCFPWWVAKYNSYPRITVSSGCSTSGGNVQCAPEAMRKAAEAKLRAAGLIGASDTLTLAEYTMGRYMQSEVGSGTVMEQVAVGEAALNQAKKWKLDGANGLLLYRQKSGHANRGYYGPIHGPGGTSTAPYGRWAATSKDPTFRTLMIARGVLRGETDNFNRGAHTQWGAEYLSNPQGLVRNQADKGNFWVGPLPGIDPWHTFLVKDYGTKLPAAEKAALLQRGLDALANKAQRVKWGDLPPCSSGPGLKLSGGAIVGLALLLSAAAGAGLYAVRSRLALRAALPAARAL